MESTHSYFPKYKGPKRENPSRKKLLIVYKGKTKTLKEWADYIKVPYTVLRKRHYAGWPLEKLFNTPHENQDTRYYKECSIEGCSESICARGLCERHYHTSSYSILTRVRGRAKKLNIPFNLDISDIVIPEYCPVLGIKLENGTGKVSPTSPTLDRTIPELGYVKGNVVIMSHKANTIKNNATLDELEKVNNYMKGVCPIR